MSWLTQGLPYPQNVYPFEDQAGVTRTPFFMGYRGQLQRWKDSWRKYRLEFILDGNRLRNLELWLWEKAMQGHSIGGGNGYRFQLMPLISESNLYPPTENEDPPEQFARIIEPPVIAAIGAGRLYGKYRVTLTVETRYDGAAGTAAQPLPTEAQEIFTPPGTSDLPQPRIPWDDLMLPLPRMQGYSYTMPAVLPRTNFSDGTRWQRKPPGGLRRQFTVSYELDIDELGRMMDFLHEQGFGESATGFQDWWIAVPLVSGETVDGSVTAHIVRVIADPKIQRIEGLNEFIVELQFEDQGPPSFVNWPPS